MEPLLHLAIPASLMLLRGGRLRWVFLAGLGGTLPDFDVFFMVHRSVSHSLSIAVIPLISGVMLRRRAYAYAALSAIALGWISHVMLDFISGLTPVIWPLSNYYYGLVFDLEFRMSSSPIITLDAQLLEEVYDYGLFKSFEAPIFTAEGLALSIILILIAIAGRR